MRKTSWSDSDDVHLAILNKIIKHRKDLGDMEKIYYFQSVSRRTEIYCNSKNWQSALQSCLHVWKFVNENNIYSDKELNIFRDKFHQICAELKHPTILQIGSLRVPNRKTKSGKTIVVCDPDRADTLYQVSSSSSPVRANIVGLKAKPELNGKQCRVHTFKSDKRSDIHGRYIVKLENGREIKIKPVNLKFPPGTMVCTIDTHSKQDKGKWINCNVGEIKGYTGENDGEPTYTVSVLKGGREHIEKISAQNIFVVISEGKFDWFSNIIKIVFRYGVRTADTTQDVDT